MQAPKLLSQNGQTYVFSDHSNKGNRLKVKIIVKNVVENNLFFDFEFKSDAKLFFGDYPMISEKGTFLINGSEKVVVFQLSRAPGVYFGEVEDVRLERSFTAEIIPRQGP